MSLTRLPGTQRSCCIRCRRVSARAELCWACGMTTFASQVCRRASSNAGCHSQHLLAPYQACVYHSKHQTHRFCTAAHKAASAADTASARPHLTAFAAWLLRRFGASHGVQPALYGTRANFDASARLQAVKMPGAPCLSPPHPHRQHSQRQPMAPPVSVCGLWERPRSSRLCCAPPSAMAM